MRSYDRKVLDDYSCELYNLYKVGGCVISSCKSNEILKFLENAKELLAKGDFIFVRRNKNLQSLADHGLTILDAKNEIFSLELSDYYKGPEDDDDPKYTGVVWTFRKIIGSNIFYVKLKIQICDHKEFLKCISFHTDEFC